MATNRPIERNRIQFHRPSLSNFHRLGVADGEVKRRHLDLCAVQMKLNSGTLLPPAWTTNSKQTRTKQQRETNSLFCMGFCSPRVGWGYAACGNGRVCGLKKNVNQRIPNALFPTRRKQHPIPIPLRLAIGVA
jgi:hypothetical protein